MKLAIIIHSNNILFKIKFNKLRNKHTIKMYKWNMKALQAF